MQGKWVEVGALLGAFALAGCMGSGVQFSGSQQPAVTQAESIEVGAHPPPGLERLGDVSAECQSLAADADVKDARASDLGCSARLLDAALREGAAESGGSFLTQPECEEKRKGDAPRPSWIGCNGEVWGPEARGDGAQAPRPPPFESARDAWRIRIDFWPATKSKRRPVGDADSVAEIDFPRVGQVKLGDLSARCAAGCAQGSMHRGLRAAAAWLGASTVVGVRCIQQEQVLSCAASITAPEHDESLAGVP
jgi:hypothetical protein